MKNNKSDEKSTISGEGSDAATCYPFTKSQLCDLMHLVQSDLKSIREYRDNNAKAIPKGVYRAINREADRLNSLDTAVVSAVQLHVDSNSG